MLYSQIKIFCCVFSISLFLVSCSKDLEDDSEDLVQNYSSEQRAENRDNNDGRNNNQGPNNGKRDRQVSVVTEWTSLFLELDKDIRGMRPTSTARALAYINLAAYEAAVPGMRDFISNSNNLTQLNIESPEDPNLNWALAVNEAYAKTFSHFIINPPANASGMINSLKASIENDRDRANRLDQDSKEWGAYVAEQVIEYSQTDVAAERQIYDPQPRSYVPPSGLGYWTFSAEPERALFPYWGNVRTFIISAEETSTIAPPIAYSEDPQSDFYQQMLKVYNANNDARAEDGEALWIAEFWSDDVESITFGPPTRQFSISNQLIDQMNLNFHEALHLNLKLGFALNDAAVSTWEDKYNYMVMRPSVFIQNFIDVTYETNLYRLIPWPNPTFPGYPSGHSAFASAAAGVFKDFFGNNIRFTDRSHEGRNEFRGTPRQFRSFDEMAKENGYSRIALGVHIEMDCTEGLRLGYEVADAINAYNLVRRNT